MTKQYLYVKVEDGYVILTTHDGIRITNEIYIEREVWAAIVRYVEEIK